MGRVVGFGVGGGLGSSACLGGWPLVMADFFFSDVYLLRRRDRTYPLYHVSPTV